MSRSSQKISSSQFSGPADWDESGLLMTSRYRAGHVTWPTAPGTLTRRDTRPEAAARNTLVT
ncbi:hypothetical protein GCM10010402_45200 [Actinomadura luteofluorescens]